jgi:nucleoside-diphosphate-sugar epimerase
VLDVRGDTVRNYSRGAYPALDKLGVTTHRGDLTDLTALRAAVAGVDVVIHVAAKAGIVGRYQEYYDANVIGTRNVVAACRQEGVQRLVYTSSPSVVFEGHDLEGVDESVPYASKFIAHYPRTKAEAEQYVLKSNGPGLATVSLRPHLLWGPGDNHLVPRILERSRNGTLRRIGYGNKRIDATYVDNAATAHVLAADRIQPRSAISGKIYFIGNDEPIVSWDLVNKICAAGGLPGATRAVPTSVAYWGSWLLETVHHWLCLSGEPRLTRFAVQQLASSHWFDLSAARRDLGYVPKVTTAEGLRRLRVWLQTGVVLHD